MDTTNRYAPPRAQVKDIPDFADTVAVPRLWNPGAAAAWSLLFSPAFGAAVHMRNWKVVGEHAKAKVALVWLVASIAVLVAAGIAAAVLPDSPDLDRITRGAGLGLLLAWYFASGRAQEKYVKDRYGSGYMRKGWGKPLGIAVLGYVVYFAVAFAVLVLIAYVQES